MYEILSTVHQGNSRFGTIFLIIITDLKKRLQALQVFAKKLFLVFSILVFFLASVYILNFLDFHHCTFYTQLFQVALPLYVVLTILYGTYSIYFFYCTMLCKMGIFFSKPFLPFHLATCLF